MGWSDPGKRNYRFFMLFLLLVVVSLVYFLIQVIIYFASKASNGGKRMSKGVQAVVIIFGSVVGFLMLLLVGFSIFHLSLKIRYAPLTRGKTTREFLKKIQTAKSEVEDNEWLSYTRPYLDYSHKFSADDMERVGQLS